MAEEELNYASVVFKTNKNPPPEVKTEEETVYDEVKVRSEPIEQTGDTDVSAGILPDKKGNKRRRNRQHLACCLGILCVLLLLGVIAVCVYLNSEHNQLKENLTSLLAENHNLKNINHNLSLEKENLRRNHNNLTVQFDNLTQAFTVSEIKTANLTTQNQNLTAENQNLKKQNQNLTAENQNLKKQNQNLTAENQNLETQRSNLTDKIQDMETKRNELRVSQAQWSIDAYCPKQNQQNQVSVRQCQPCQGGWLHSQSDCYVIIDNTTDKRTWDEAQKNCKIKISDLAVIVNEEEKAFIKQNSWSSSGTNGYWIGLRVEDGKWKWVDGSDLTETSWISPPTEGHCAISVVNDGWKSVSCDDKNRWVCRQKALSV